jgi:hypothetical protein
MVFKLSVLSCAILALIVQSSYATPMATQHCKQPPVWRINGVDPMSDARAKGDLVVLALLMSY